MLSVALFLTFRLVAINHYVALWCSDFPSRHERDDKAIYLQAKIQLLYRNEIFIFWAFPSMIMQNSLRSIHARVRLSLLTPSYRRGVQTYDLVAERSPSTILNAAEFVLVITY